MPSSPPLFASVDVPVTLAMAAANTVDDTVDDARDSEAESPPPAPSRPELFRPPMSYLRRSTTGPADAGRSAADHDRRKELERRELVEMILESIANVPVAVQRIHTNAKLRAALADAIGEENALLGRFFSLKASAQGSDGGEKTGQGEETTISESLSVENLRRWDEAQQRQDLALLPHEIFSDYSSDAKKVDSDLEEVDGGGGGAEEGASDDSSGFGSEYEKDLAEAVNQLCVSDDILLTAMENQMTAPIPISGHSSSGAIGGGSQSARVSNSPSSSICLGVSPGAGVLLDGEPVSAIWPRQPNQFAFTQEEEVALRGEDEVYSEMVSSVGGDEEDGDDADEKLFLMEDEEGGLENEIASYDRQPRLADANAAAFEDADPVSTDLAPVDGDEGGDDDDGDSEGNENDDDDTGDEPSKREYEVFQLRIIRQKNRTGFEPKQDWRPRVGRLIGGRYKVQMAIGEAVFSRTYKCLDITTNQTVCLKIIKNNKEYFDQGVDEIRVMELIARSCNVDEKHVVRLVDYFYFREHLIIVTELLRDNLYEFSRLLMARGVINYFNMGRLKKIAIEVLEALQFLHSLGLVHCDLKPENILVSNFNQCTVKVIDFGSACFVTDELTSYVQSRSYRAPEVILGLVYDQKIDLWSLGCVLAELFTGEVLFKNDSEQTLLARIIATIGRVPAPLLADRPDLQKQFEENPLFALDAAGNGALAAALPLPPLEGAVQASDAQFVAFLRALLQIDPSVRLSAAEALAHPWLQHGVFSGSRT